MNNEYKGEIKLADGTPIGRVVDFQFEQNHDVPPAPKFDFRELFKPVTAHVVGTFTPGDGLNDFIEKMFSEVEYATEAKWYISQQTVWMLEYLAQGKRYPKPRKQKSKVWRERMKKKYAYE